MTKALEITRAVQLEEIAFLQAQLAAVEALLDKRTQKSDPVGHYQFTQRKNEIAMELSALQDGLIPEDAPVVPEFNGTLTTFKRSGKYYAEGRGYFSRDCFTPNGFAIIREIILSDNGGKCPGLSSQGSDFIWVVRPDDTCEGGYPLLLKPPVILKTPLETKTMSLTPAQEAIAEQFARAFGFAEAPVDTYSLYLNSDKTDKRLFEHYRTRKPFTGADRWYAAAAYIREWIYHAS